MKLLTLLLLVIVGWTSSSMADEPLDTLVVTARLMEIPGTMPPNDLYNYVYVMKYRVTEVEQGVYEDKELYVGQYNPLIPRAKISDKMDEFVDGDVEEFKRGDMHRLLLVRPIINVWEEAMEDEYFEVADEDKWFALKTDEVEK